MHHLPSLLSIFSKQFQLSKHRFCIRMHHFFPLFSKFSQQFQLSKNRFKQRQNAPFCVLAFKFYQQFQLREHRFKYRQNAPFIVFDFKNFSAVPNSEKKYSYSVRMHHLMSFTFNMFSSFSTSENIVQNAQECSFQCPQFQNFLSSANFALQVMSRRIVFVNTQYSLLSIYNRSY